MSSCDFALDEALRATSRSRRRGEHSTGLSTSRRRRLRIFTKSIISFRVVIAALAFKFRTGWARLCASEWSRTGFLGGEVSAIHAMFYTAGMFDICHEHLLRNQNWRKSAASPSPSFSYEKDTQKQFWGESSIGPQTALME